MKGFKKLRLHKNYVRNKHLERTVSTSPRGNETKGIFLRFCVLLVLRCNQTKPVTTLNITFVKSFSYRGTMTNYGIVLMIYFDIVQA